MAKNKYADNVVENIRWFAEHRHEFNFSGSNEYFLSKIFCYKRSIGTEQWIFENKMSESSYEAAFGKFSPSILKGEHSEWKLEKETEDCIVHDLHGVNAIEAFIQIDSYGVVKPTRHPTLLLNLLIAKASLNLHIQMYAQDRANGRLPKMLFDELAEEFEFKPWMKEAVENQRWNYDK